MSDKIIEKSPLVSIITVTYNAGDTIVSTMISVGNQTASDYEHIIMDGASKDDTLSRINASKTEKTRVFSSEDNGIYDAMNKALGKARGKYVLFLNSGDRFASDKVLQTLIQIAVQNDSPGIIYGQTDIIDSTGKVVGHRHLKAPEKLTLDSFKSGMVVCHQAFMVLKKIAPLYSPIYRFSADYEWCIRCLQHSRTNIYAGDEPLIHYLNEGLTTRNHRASLIERFKIMCNYFGTFQTVIRHVGFAARYALRRKNSINNQ